MVTSITIAAAAIVVIARNHRSTATEVVIDVQASDVIALAALIVAIASVVLRLTDRRAARILRQRDQAEAKRTSVILALQGEKESVGYEAYRVTKEGWTTDPNQQRDLRDALCFAAIFSSSDRSRAMVYRALKEHPEGQNDELRKVLSDIRMTFEAADAANSDINLDRGWRRLRMLCSMLGMLDVMPKERRCER